MMGCAARNNGLQNEMGTTPNNFNGQNGATNQGTNTQLATTQGFNTQGTNPQDRTTRFIGLNPNGNNSGNQLSQSMSSDRQRAENIKSQLKSLAIGQPNVIVNGNTAIIGLSTSGMNNGRKADAKTIEAKVKAIDPSITNVVVTESPDAVNEMNRMSTDITNDTPANEAKASFDKLMRMIRPQT